VRQGQQRSIPLPQGNNIVFIRNGQKLAPAPHPRRAVTEFVSIQLASSFRQIVAGKQRLLAFGAKCLDFFGVEQVTAVTALQVGQG